MKKIGVIDYGTIGRYLCKKIANENDIQLEFVFDPFIDKNEYLVLIICYLLKKVSNNKKRGGGR